MAAPFLAPTHAMARAAKGFKKSCYVEIRLISRPFNVYASLESTNGVPALFVSPNDFFHPLAIIIQAILAMNLRNSRAWKHSRLSAHLLRKALGPDAVFRTTEKLIGALVQKKARCETILFVPRWLKMVKSVSFLLNSHGKNDILGPENELFFEHFCKPGISQVFI